MLHVAKIELMDSYSYTYIKGEIPDLFVMSDLNCDRTCDFIIMQCRTVEDSIYMSIFDLLCFNVTKSLMEIQIRIIMLSKNGETAKIII